jgi:hypothetical protein
MQRDDRFKAKQFGPIRDFRGKTMATLPNAAKNLHVADLSKRFTRPSAPFSLPDTDTLAEERREVLDGIVESLRWGTGDPEARAACRQLLRHLASSPCSS